MKVTQKQCVSLLKKYSLRYSSDSGFEGVLRHSTVVKQVAEGILKDISGFSTKNGELSLRKDKKEVNKIDMDLVLAGAMLHDIGRFKCPPNSKDSIRHGIEGYNILMGEGLSDLAQIAKNHIGFGIKKSDIIMLGLNLPKQDFIPTTIEEKIVCFADKLVNYDSIISFDDCLRRFAQEIGLHTIKRGILLENEIMRLCGNQGIKIANSKDLIKFVPDKKIKELWNNSFLKTIFSGKSDDNSDNQDIKNPSSNNDFLTTILINVINNQQEKILSLILNINNSGELFEIIYDEIKDATYVLEISDANILEIYERSEEIYEDPKLIIDYIDYVNVPENLKQMIILALLNR